MDLTKLSIDQLEIADKVMAEAERQGVNPALVLPLVMQESGFDQSKKSKKGALGVMQLMPNTAKELGVDPSDVDQNIRGGITYFKQQLNNPAFAGDITDVYIAYNAGPNSKFFKTRDLKDLPGETADYLNKVDVFEEDKLPRPARQQASVAVPELPPAAEAAGEADDAAGDAATSKKDRTLNPLIGAGFGAGLGASAGTAAASTQAKYDAATRAYDALINRGTPPVESFKAPPVPPVASPAAATASTPKYGGQNWVKSLTDVDLPGAQMGKADLDAAKGMQAAVGRSGAPGFTGGTITQGGVIVSPQTAAAIKPTPMQVTAANAKLMREAKQKVATERALAEMMANPTKQPPPPPPSGVSAYLKRLGALPVRGGVAGAGIGLGAVDAYNRFSADDKVGGSAALGATALGTAFPIMGPLAASAMMLYDDPEKRKKFLEAMKPDGRYQKRMEGRFGLD
tara:strand:- start:10593 stop:11960 length:1368 start_codon:yes stop_codon:yes gene_type:complete